MMNVNSIGVSSDALFTATGRVRRLLPKEKDTDLYQPIFSMHVENKKNRGGLFTIRFSVHFSL